MSIWAELKRRNVFKVGIAYVLMGWVLLQGADFVLDLIGAPDWVIRVFTLAIAVGLPIALFFTWAFELTPEGIKRESDVDRSQSITRQTGRKLDFAIIGILVIALGWFAWDKFLHQDSELLPVASDVATDTPRARPAPGAVVGLKTVAVLPFVAMSSGPDDEYFADGLTEEILNALAQLPELLVTARTSAFSFKGQDKPIQEIAEALGVAHIVEGSVRRSGDRLRMTVQLVRASDGFHLWSENYDSTEADTITIQEEVAEQIATSLNVVLDEGRREAMRNAGLRDVTAFILFQKGREAAIKAHGDYFPGAGLKQANVYFEQVLQRVPDYASAYIEHADLYVHLLNDTAFGATDPGVEPEDIDNALELAIRDYSLAVDNVHSFDRRGQAEFDLAMLRGDLRGIGTRMTAQLAVDNCDRPAWIDPIGTLFGYARDYAGMLERIRTCDPLLSTVWFAESRALIWAGDPEAALKLLADAKGRLEHTWLNDAEVFALLALGQYESAGNQAATRYSEAAFREQSLSVTAAAAGNPALSDRHFQNFLALDQGLDNYFALQHYAQTGQREQANAIAAEVDAKAFGPLPLMLATMWCTCGAPFDLGATPNFAARLAEGNLPWPPPSPIRFPLKDWP